METVSGKTGRANSVESSDAQCTYCHSDCDGILLTPEDLYNISSELQLTPGEVFRRYCWGAIDGYSHVPIVFLKTCHPHSSVRKCPFFNNGKCNMGKSKPSICTFPPIGNQMKKRRYTLSECLMINGTRYKKDFIIRLQNDIAEIGETLCILDKVKDHKSMKNAWTECYIDLYLHYDTKQDFMPQYEENMKFLKGFLQWILLHQDQEASYEEI